MVLQSLETRLQSRVVRRYAATSPHRQSWPMHEFSVSQQQTMRHCRAAVSVTKQAIGPPDIGAFSEV